MSLYYTGVVLLVIIAMITFSSIVWSNVVFSKKNKKLLITSYALIMAGIVLEWISIYLQFNVPDAIRLHTVLKSISLSKLIVDVHVYAKTYPFNRFYSYFMQRVE